MLGANGNPQDPRPRCRPYGLMLIVNVTAGLTQHGERSQAVVRDGLTTLTVSLQVTPEQVPRTFTERVIR
jgi:hypothetical protein